MEKRLKKITLLLANERSGTHFVRSVLENGASVWSPGEVCNAKADCAEENLFSYFAYRQRFFAQNPKHMYPTATNTYELTNAFFEFLGNYDASQCKDVVLVDLKYGHLWNFDCFWRNIHERPQILTFAESEQLSVLHLSRRRIHQTAISEIYAQASGIWHLGKDQRRGEMPMIRISRGELESAAKRIESSINAVRVWLKGLNCLEIAYEDLCSDNQLEAFNCVAEFLGISDLANVESTYIKATPPYSEIIENLEEIDDLLLKETC